MSLYNFTNNSSTIITILHFSLLKFSLTTIIFMKKPRVLFLFLAVSVLFFTDVLSYKYPYNDLQYSGRILLLLFFDNSVFLLHEII